MPKNALEIMPNASYDNFALQLAINHEVGPEWIRSALIHFSEYILRYRHSPFSPKQYRKLLAPWREIACQTGPVMASSDMLLPGAVAGYIRGELARDGKGSLTPEYCHNAIYDYGCIIMSSDLTATEQELDRVQLIINTVSRWIS